MNITQLDHMVLTVNDIQATINFYCNVLGMQLVELANDRKALKYGNQKINLHEVDNEFSPHALHPVPGSADLCFLLDDELESIQYELFEHNIEIIEGPVTRTGTNGKIRSIYIRDPDSNLIELANYL